MSDLKFTLQSARAFLAAHEWGQGAQVLEDKHCLSTAIQWASGSGSGFMRQSDFQDAMEAMRRTLGVENSPGGAVKWNDTPGRTKEEVLAAFDKAIAEAE